MVKKGIVSILNEKTPVISRSLFINQKTNSHDKLLLRFAKYNFYTVIPISGIFNINLICAFWG